MIAPRKLQLRRGNTAAISTYVGAPGELIVNTDNSTLYIHDGVTVGGRAATVNTASTLNAVASAEANIILANTIQSAQIASANIGIIGYINQGNTIQAAIITAANLGMKGYVDSVAGGSNYSNVNVKAYTETMGFQNFSNVNVAAYLTSQGVTGGSYSNVNAVSLITSLGLSNYSNVNVKAYAESMGFQNYGNVNVAAYVTTANSAIIGYIDLANTIQSAQVNAANLAIVSANLGMKGYVDSVASQSIYGNGNVKSYLTEFDGNIVPSANVTYSLGSDTNRWKDLYLSGNTIFLGDTTISTSGGAVLTPVTRQLFSQSFLPGGTNSAATFTLDRLPTAGSTRTVVVIGEQGIDPPGPAPSYTLTEGVDFTISGLSLIITASYTATNISCTESYSDTGDLITATEVATDTITPGSGDLTVSGNVTVDGDLYVSPTSIYMGNLRISAADGNLKVNTGIKFSDDSVQSTAYSNVQVATYLQSGNIANVSVAGNITATYFLGNGALLTGIVASGSGTNYSNTNVIAYLNATGYNLYSNVNLIAYLAGNITTGNVTATGFIGNGAGLTNVTFSQAGNIVGTQSNVTLQAGTFTSVFNNQGNVTMPNVYVSGNVTTGGYFIGNGALLTGITAVSSYSNVQVATYLPTYDGVVTAGNVAVNGNVTAQYFLGNGALLTGIVGGAGNYGNANVKAFLAAEVEYDGGYQRKIQGYYANLDLGSTAALYSFGVTSKSYLGHNGLVGNTGISTVIVDNYDIKISTNNAAYNWTFDNTGTLTFPTGNLTIFPRSVPFSNAAVIASALNNLVTLSTGVNGGTSSLWVEDYENIGTSNIAAVYANPTVGSKIVRIAVGQNGGPYGPNLWDFGNTGTTRFPNSTILAPAGNVRLPALLNIQA